MRKSTLIAASLQRSGLLLLGAFFIVFVYTTLHEGGHALAGLLSGGTVSRIDVNFFDLSAHALIDGAFTRGQQAVIAVAGWALPALAVLLGVLVLARDVRSDRLEISLRGPDGWNSVLLRGKGYSAAEDRSNPSWEQMPTGHYEVALSGSPARGEIWLYVKQ